MILTNTKATSFGLSKLSGRTAQGHLLGPSGGSTAVGAALSDKGGSRGAPPDSLRIKRRKQVVFFDFFSLVGTKNRYEDDKQDMTCDISIKRGVCVQTNFGEQN